jgi:anti-repressor protein
MSDDEMISKALVVAASKLKALEAKTAEQSGVIEAQAAKIEADAPKVTLAEAITSSGSYITVGQLANIVYQDGTETGRTRMFKHLRKYDWVIKDGSDHNRPTQKGMDSGFFRLDEEHRHINGIPQYDKAGRPIFDMVTKISPTGQAHFVNQFHEFRKRSLLDFLPRPRRSSNRLETI